jgi:hypothetical protein
LSSGEVTDGLVARRTTRVLDGFTPVTEVTVATTTVSRGGADEIPMSAS